MRASSPSSAGEAPAEASPRCRRRRPLGSELGLLHRDRAPCLALDLLKREPSTRRDRGGDGPLDEGRLTERHLAVRIQELDRHLGAHHGTAEIHQHEHAVIGHRPFDCSTHTLDVGPDRAVLETARGLDRELLTAHLPCQLDDAVGQRRAVRDDDDPDHVYKR